MKTFKPIRINPWREISILMIILMEVSWITPWFRSLTIETYLVNSLNVLTIFTIIVLASHLLVRLMDYLCIKKSIRQGLIIIFLFICCIFGVKTLLYSHVSSSLLKLLTQPISGFTEFQSIIPVEFLVIVAVMIGVWRGITLAQQSIGPSLVKSHFWVGIMMFVAFIFIVTLATGENPGEFFYLFLFSALVGVSASRMFVVGMIRGGIENQFNLSWFLGILFSTMVVVGLSSLIGGIFSEQFGWLAGLLAGLIGSFLLLVWLIINPVISLIITVIGKIFNYSGFFDELQDSFQNLNNLMLGFGERIADLVSQSKILKLLSLFAPAIKNIILVSIIIVIIGGIVLWITINIWKDRERKNQSEEEKLKIPFGNLINSLLGSIQQGWKKAINSLDQLLDLNRRRRIRSAARIRQIYADLLEVCASLGQPRPEAITPLEFLPKINQLFPELQNETSLITNAYLDVRYGLLPENKEVNSNIEIAWKKLQAIGHKRLHERMKSMSR